MPSNAVPYPLPKLVWEPTQAYSSRHGVVPTLVVVHRWAGGTIDSVIREFKNPRLGKSSTFVYDGFPSNRLVQMIRLRDKPWTQSTWNPHCVSFECNDRMWLGRDDEGLHTLARMVARVLHTLGSPPKWIRSPGALIRTPHGWCRHADLGALGGGHTQCPTTDVALARKFQSWVRTEYYRGGFRKNWERR